MTSVCVARCKDDSTDEVMTTSLSKKKNHDNIPNRSSGNGRDPAPRTYSDR